MPFFETKKKIESDTTVVGRFKILIGDVRERLKDIPDNSVHCCVTSPPYWGLRDYGTGTWEGGDPDCDHVQEIVSKSGGDGLQYLKKGHEKNLVARGDCIKCGATRIDKQIGLEKTPQEYVATMVEVFHEVRRVLREDGVCWLNLGDSYFGDSMPRKKSGETFSDSWNTDDSAGNGGIRRSASRCGDLKPKDLVGIPWRVAFALQADGWWLRQDIIWSKNNPMPESVTSRCTKSHEYIFLLAKSNRYFFDNDAIREKSKAAWNPKKGFGTLRRKAMFMDEKQLGLQRTQFAHKTHHDDEDKIGRNKRSVWNIKAQPYEEAHFATYPPELVIPCVKAGTSEKGCCSKCGAPWERVVEKDRTPTRPGRTTKVTGDPMTDGNRDPLRHVTTVTSIGWQPTCECNAEVVPCIVLDPFLGSGTTLQVARWLGRNGIGIELSGDFAALAKERIMKPPYE